MRVKKLVYLDAQQEKRVKLLARKEAAEVAADTKLVMKHIQAHSGGWVDDPAKFFHG